MTADELREKFLLFFEQRGHKRIDSSPLIPKGDPTLLLTSAGMVQFKPYFTGEAVPPSPRLASCQKCFRTTDIESVGNLKHLTFFEMLGNFSIGDYFKKEAIAWAWEFVLDWLKLPKEKLWITIFLDDDESFHYWRDVGVEAERIDRYGEEDNFWGPAGESGPCGPCSEIHYDYGEEYGCGPDCAPGCDCGRFLEIWNLVFTEYFQDSEGKRTPLPRKNIDTGMGLERTAAILQGKRSFYETDLFAPIVQRVSELTGRRYGEDEKADRAMRIVAEHARAVTFLIADGVLPSNEGRGYVLRRVLRRSVIFGRKLGLRRTPFLENIAEAVIEKMKHVYPELMQNYAQLLTVIDEEEKRFDETLGFGLNLFDVVLEGMKDKEEKTIPGEVAFHFYDTYGLPWEVMEEVAAESGREVDRESFERELERQRERARAAHKFRLGEIADAPAYTGGRANLPEIEFVGHDSYRLRHRSDVLQLAIKGTWKTRLFEGDEGEVVLRETPFYGEMGGQVGDTGEIHGPQGHFVVEDTIRPWPELTVHRGKVVEGYISLNDAVEARVDKGRRLDIARNHTATHLLQAALRQVLGEHVHQMGSLVAPDHFRFDFSSEAPVLREELGQIQRIVNESIRRNLSVTKKEVPYTQAVAQGAIALFGEKYGDVVRVVRIGGSRSPVSLEVCGGTHVNRTGDIGLFHILSEGSIGSGMRRIEAVTGSGAEALVEERVSTLEKIAHQLQVPTAEVDDKLGSVLQELDAERKRAIALERQLSKETAESLLAQVESVNGVSVLAASVPASNIEVLRHMGDILRERLGSAVIVLGAVWAGRPNFLAMVTSDLVARGLNAGDIVKEVAREAGGSGGGRPQLGQGGGRDKDRLEGALNLVASLVRGKI
jgi:alanyl-tRNA synthetase